MIDDKDSEQLTEYCFNVCEVLKTVVQGRNTAGINESVRVAFEYLERCVNLPRICLLPHQATPGSQKKSSGL